MSEAIAPSLPRKLWMTPWRDLLRGRLTLRLDVAARIHAAEIPEKAKIVITEVVRRTRLWRSEKVAVAEELIAHFADGMGAGESIEKLVEKFGDKKRAAKLIRRAKVRNRPMAWRATGVAVRVVEAMIAVHLLLAAYFFAGHPSPNVDYMAQLNQPVLATPEDQRAWPLYRQAILKIADYQPPKEFDDPSVDELAPGKNGWPWMTAWLRHHVKALSLIRQASAMPALGFVYGPHGSADDPALFPNLYLSDAVDSLQPDLNPLRRMAELLGRDSDLAMQDQDSVRFVGDISAMLGMANQLRREDFWMCGLIAVGGRMQVVDQINVALTQQTKLLNDLQLQTLAHEIARFGTAADMFNLRGNRLSFYEEIQRKYTDDGRGDGRLTHEGAHGVWGTFVVTDNAEMFTLGPWIMALTASRSQTVDLYERWALLADADLHKPLRDSPEAAADKLRQATWAPGWQYYKYLTFAHSNFPLRTMRINAEVLLGERDGVEVGLALEVYHRQHGQYPQSIQELVPALLPSVPIDRITGDPVKYKIVNGQPIVYSVGVDRKDDGGRPPIIHGEADNRAAARWPGTNQAGQPIPDGDWILYPLPKSNN